nr:hypothetical protein CFP56_25375 [Quercus suber]
MIPSPRINKKTTGFQKHKDQKHSTNVFFNYMEEVKISISTRRSDLSEKCMRAFKSSLRTTWKMGPVLRGGSVEKRKEEVAGVAPMGTFLASLGTEHSIASSNHRGLGGWSETGENSGLLGFFEKHGVDCRGGLVEKRKEEVAGVAPMGTFLASLGTEHSIASSNHRGLGGWSEVLSVVRPLSPVPSSVVHSCLSQRFSMMGMGFQMLFPVAQKLSRLKPTSKPSPKYEPISILLCPMRRILKRVTRA